MTDPSLLNQPQAPSASTATATPAALLRPSNTWCPTGCGCRRESFGLLFYDTRSTKLTFVRSGDSLEAPPFMGPRRALEIGPAAGGRSPALARLLQDLVAKGLIVAAEV